jgi:hypothetical protein
MAAEPAGTLNPDLASLQSQFAAIREDAAHLVEDLNDDAFNWEPAPGRWSIGQCFAHLNIVDGKDVDMMAVAIENARSNGVTGEGPFRYGALSSYFIKMMEPETRLKAKAPRVYVPPPRADLGLTMAEFWRVQTRLAQLVVAANGVDLARVKVSTPMATWIRFSLGQRFRLIAAHDRRHLFQAWEVRRSLR